MDIMDFRSIFSSFVLELRRWLIDILIAIDQLANVVFKWPLNWIFGVRGFGHPDETISSVLGKHYQTCRLCRIVCKFLSRFLGEKHCRKAVEKDEGYHP